MLIIKSIDRLGRNYKMIIEEWSFLTKHIQSDIFVIDFPLLDTRNKDHNLMGSFISDLVLQVLSFVAETERQNIKLRQAEGIRIAKEKGKHLGRPKYVKTAHFEEIASLYRDDHITLKYALSKLKISKATFIKYMNQ